LLYEINSTTKFYLKKNPHRYGIIIKISPEDYVYTNSNILPIQLIYNKLEYKNYLNSSYF